MVEDPHAACALYYEVLRMDDPGCLIVFQRAQTQLRGGWEFPGSAKQTLLRMEKRRAEAQLRQHGRFYKGRAALVGAGVGAVILAGYFLRLVHYMRHSWDLVHPNMKYLENRF